ncbi:probable LysM and putative peptidoglycan-binding domain-containing protein at N-terminal half [Coccomyxa sp. Obi]|nr:probable LysM and putative peptidoglycan-binding domain-containing protein at N-terminal half [Coccomyxa sp. Obi]
MSDDRPSTSTSSPDESSDTRAPFVTHQVTKFDTLAGLAVRYHVSVSDIKRSNGLLSDSAMYAKDTLLIPTRAMPPLGVEYQTWAGMIVTQYGRIPGDQRSNGIRFGGDGSHGGSPPRQSAALDKLQRYYGTGDTCSEPEDFKPGSSGSGLDRLVRLARLGGLDQGRSSDIEIEMADFERHQREPPHSPTAGLLRSTEYAGSRDGPRFDERLRRRKGPESTSDLEPSANGVESSGEPLTGSAARPPIPPRGSPGSSGATTALGAQFGGVPDPGGTRRQSIMDRLKRAASQPSLAGLPASLGSVPKGIVKAAEALIARSDSGGSTAGASSTSLRASVSAPGIAEPAAKAPAAARPTSPGLRSLRQSSSNSNLAVLGTPPKKKD